VIAEHFQETALLHTYSHTEIGTTLLADDAHYYCEDRTGLGRGTATGIRVNTERKRGVAYLMRQSGQ
jgi:hypothetical protein